MSIRKLEPDMRLAIRSDVEEIVTRVVSTLIPALVPPIVERIVDEKIAEFAIMVKHGFDECAKKQDLDEFKAEMIEFKTDMLGFKGEMTSFRHETKQSLFCLQSDVTDLKGRMDRVKNGLGGVECAIGVMTGMWRDHEARICALEF